MQEKTAFCRFVRLAFSFFLLFYNERIRALREDRDLSQKQLSQALHCSQQVYSNYELGQRDIPTAILIALADFYGTSTDYILGRTDEK